MELKAEIWERVMDFASLLASEDKTEKYWAHYNGLRDYCETQSVTGHDHPFLWESLGDFTTDDSAAIPLYLRALDLAMTEDSLEYRVSIRFLLAERYRRSGQEDLALEYAIAADNEARELSDLDLRRRISKFLISPR